MRRTLHRMDSQTLGTLDAVATAAAVREGRISARETVQAALARIEERNGPVNAFTVVRAESALAEADELDAVGPSAGLHGEDAEHVVHALASLVDEGASVVMVEHDLSVIRAADWVIDLGPGGGPDGGRVVACGIRTCAARRSARSSEGWGPGSSVTTHPTARTAGRRSFL